MKSTCTLAELQGSCKVCPVHTIALRTVESRRHKDTYNESFNGRSRRAARCDIPEGKDSWFAYPARRLERDRQREFT